jgi:2-polyprenyl-3-methyl-5-hydroxy-6-metoxy-1,4-benzoquinol methylase
MFTQRFAKIEGISFLDGYDVVSCKRCCFVYASNIPEQAAFDEYYINMNKYEHDIEQPDIITGRQEYIVEEIIRFNIDKAASVIDIGCARSEVLRSLQNKGFTDLTGADTSIKNVEYLKNKGINAIHATIATLATSKQYDVVLFLDVLEHVQDLRFAVSALYNITATNGMVIVSVPDMTTLASTELPYQEFSREHINYFTPTSLSNLMVQHGFHTVFQKSGLGLFRKSIGEAQGGRSIQKDSDSRQCIKRYIEQSKKYEHEINERLLPYSETPIIIWGLGTFTQRLLENTVLKNIVALVDSNPQYVGKKYKNISTISPSELKQYKAPVLIATSLRYVDDIVRAMRDELKVENEIIKLCSNYSFEY